jgi:hypothetical protein
MAGIGIAGISGISAAGAVGSGSGNLNATAAAAAAAAAAANAAAAAAAGSSALNFPAGPFPAGYIGSYSPEARRERIARFVAKRDKRVWTKKVKYDVRKNFADSRLRVKVGDRSLCICGVCARVYVHLFAFVCVCVLCFYLPIM